MQVKYLKPIAIVVAIVYFVSLVIAKAPAAWVAHALHQAVPVFWLNGVTGTAWSGHAKNAQLDIGARAVPMGDFRWRINGFSLLTLNPCITFETQFANQPFSGKACYGVIGGQASISQLTLGVPIELFNDMLPMRAGGQASIDIVKAKLDGTLVKQLDARVSVQDIRVNPAEGWIELGTYAAQVKESGNGGIAAKVFDIEAPFVIDLNVGWGPQKDDYNVAGSIKLTENSPQDVVSAIEIFASEREAEPGHYDLVWP